MTDNPLADVVKQLKEIKGLLNDVNNASLKLPGNKKGGPGGSSSPFGGAISMPVAPSAFSNKGNGGYQSALSLPPPMAPPSMGGGGGMTAGSAAVRGAGIVGGMVLGMMPSASSAVDMQQALFQSALYGSANMGRQDFNRLSRMVQGKMGNYQTSVGSAQRSAAIASQNGFAMTKSGGGMNILGQVGAISLSTGMSNEQVTGIISSQSTNAVMTNRLRALGFEMFDAQGNPKDLAKIARHIVGVVYGQNPKPEQIQRGLRPGGALDLMLQSYIPDPGMQTLIKDNMFKQALNNGQYAANDAATSQKLGLSDSNLNPRNAGMRYASSDSRKTNATRDSAVAGYTTGLDVASNLNDAFTTLAEDAGILSSAFQGLAATMGFGNGFGATGPGQVALSAIGSIPVVGPIINGILGAFMHADGGPIKGPGGPRDDKVPALLSNGEYVINADSVQKYGKGLFEALNSKKFADGGEVTLSGHPALQPGSKDLTTVGVAGGRNITVADWTAPLFQRFLEQWQQDPNLGGGRLSLTTGPLDSYEYRKARQSDGVSDHAGYAIDIRYDVLSADGQAHMRPAETAAVRRIIGAMGGQLSWGGEWSSGSTDEMHIYVSPGVDSAREIVSSGDNPNSTLESSQNLTSSAPAMVASAPLFVGTALGSSVSGMSAEAQSVLSAIQSGPVYAPLGVQQDTTRTLQDSTTGGTDTASTTKSYGNGVLNGKDLVNLLHDGGFSGTDLRTAYGVVMGESGGDPRAKHENPGKDGKTGSIDWGLFQINDYWNKQAGGETVDFGAKIFDPVYNTHIAKLIKNSAGWNDWNAYQYRSDEYQKGLADYDKHPDWYQGYSKGLWRVDNDQIARIHQNEMILPAPTAEAVRTVMRETSAGVSPGSGTRKNNVEIHLTVAKATDEEAVRIARKVKALMDDDRVLKSIAMGSAQ